MTMGKRIREVRGELSQEKFSKIVGISKGAVGSYENDKQTPSATVIMSICDNFNIEPRWLLKGEGEKFDNKAIHNSSDLLRHNMFMEKQEEKIKSLEYQLAEIKEELKISRLEIDRAQAEALKAMKIADMSDRIARLEAQVTITEALNGGAANTAAPVSAPSAPSTSPNNDQV